MAVVIPHFGNWTFTNCGTTNFDSYMYLSSGCCAGLIQANDDACGTQSRINWTGGPDTVYVTMEAYNQQDAYSCVLYVFESSPLTLSCPGNQVLGTCLLPNFTDIVTVTDTCGATLTQSPAPGVPVLPGDSLVVTITATDISGVEGACTFTAYAPPAPSIEILGDSFICVFDSTELSFLGNPAYFSWSTGETTNTIVVQEGLYYLVGINIEQCISLDSILVVQWPSPVPLIQEVGDTLFEVNGPFTTYQWYLEGSVIAGATGPFYVPTESGFYQVEVTDTNSCPGITVGFPFAYVVGVPNSMAPENMLRAWPNPTSGALHVKGLRTGEVLRIFDATGRLLRSVTPAATDFSLDLGGLPSGLYWVENGGNRVMVVKE